MGGGVEWDGAAFSPLTDSLFVGAVDACAHVQLVTELAVPAIGQVWFGTTGSMAQIADPPAMGRGWLTAFDAENGRVRWKYQAPRPIVAGVTPTAGDLVFTADRGGDVFALDQRHGHVLWQTNTGQSTVGGVVVYRAEGHELLGIASGTTSLGGPPSADKSRILVYGLRSDD
jgi:alcohol dehydrogenase (cytochrome c)